MKKHTTKLTSKSIEGSGLPSDYKKAIAEYIWNGFDAGASTINIDFSANSIGTLESFSISDNGVKIPSISIPDVNGFIPHKDSIFIGCGINSTMGLQGLQIKSICCGIGV